MGPHMQERIKDLEKEIREIKQRNLRVEADKAWEVSWTRIFFISISTYIIGEFLSKKCALSPRLPYVILIATVLIGVFLFKEKLSMLGITGIILVFISIVLLLMN